MTTIGETIAILRKKQNMTQEALAGLIGVSAQSVSKWENNTHMPDICLLPVLADIFQCRIDDLFGRGSAMKSGDPERILDNCCETVLAEIGSCVYGHCSHEEYTNAMTDYKMKLKKTDRQRSAVVRPHGIVYYREKLGALLLRRPEEGWQSLLENDRAEACFRLLENKDFRRVLAEICRSRIFTFTPGFLCSRCGIQDEADLEKHLKESGLFGTKEIDVDGRQITIYEMIHSERLAMLFAVLSYAAEFEEYEDYYTCFFGCGIEGMLE